MHRLDLGLYSYVKEFVGNEVRTHVNFKGQGGEGEWGGGVLCTGRLQ